jgi:hypothetical protein
MGLVISRSRPSPFVLALAAATSLLHASLTHAAEPAPGVQADIKRAFAAVGLSNSEEPAVRQERQAREPSPGFMVGAALGAWTNAAAQLDFDLKNPAGVGPPHVNLDDGPADFIQQDCADEKAAFDRLATRSQALGLTPQQVAAAAGAADKGVATVWQMRQGGPVKACR